MNLFEFLPADIQQMFSGAFRPRLFVNLGIAALMLTPYVRVLASLLYFAVCATSKRRCSKALAQARSSVGGFGNQTKVASYEQVPLGFPSHIKSPCSSIALYLLTAWHNKCNICIGW